jgi:mono/diheme cytochrome c family protein
VVLLGLPAALVLVAWVAPAAVMLRWRSGAAPAARAPHPTTGAALYAQHCAYCHGDRGDGAGVTAAYVWPRPRDFGEGKFRLVTTQNGIPTDDDLLAVLRNGIPGSAMPPFAHLGEPELRALIGHVRELTYTGVLARLRRLADQGAIDPTEVGLVADTLSRPGPQLEIPAHFAPATPESIARGREVYTKTCASCHGPTGRGDGPQVQELKNADGSPTRPRDLTLGQFKGGGEPAQVYARIMLGMPGTPMPASNNLPPGDVQDLLNYVLSLSRTEAREGTDVTRSPAHGQ